MLYSDHNLKYAYNFIYPLCVSNLVNSDIHSILNGLFVVAITMLQKPFSIDEFSVHS